MPTLAWLWTVVLLLCGVISSAAVAEQQRIRLATTTSVEASGLLDYLLPMFQRDNGIKVEVLAVGTGQALAIGRRGDADILITHAPSAEQAMIDSGYAVEAISLMSNRFLIVGPRSDPADIAHSNTIGDALERIAKGHYRFVSRGDNSGTYMKEQSIWQSLSVKTQWHNYYSIGQGMAATLRMANELDAYTLTDRGTWLAQGKQLTALRAFGLDGAELYNPYRILILNDRRHGHIKSDQAMTFARWLTSAKTQHAIADFKKHGQWLFCPELTSARVDCE